jgi:hypothetical protein
MPPTDELVMGRLRRVEARVAQLEDWRSTLNPRPTSRIPSLTEAQMRFALSFLLLVTFAYGIAGWRKAAT